MLYACLYSTNSSGPKYIHASFVIIPWGSSSERGLKVSQRKNPVTRTTNMHSTHYTLDPNLFEIFPFFSIISRTGQKHWSEVTKESPRQSEFKNTKNSAVEILRSFCKVYFSMTQNSNTRSHSESHQVGSTKQ